MPKRYRKLRGDTAYYPFAARTGLRARQRRHVRVLRGAGLAALALAAVLLALGLGCVVYLLYHFWGGGQE